ncbi:hypothetical protein J3D43_003446 [Paenibacillus xylanexedens]|nr:phosphoribosyltransferase family protein [Paenibacillus xylanexedens]MCP1424930.1 hypothetical protein [Paenibacillus xylanexedens]
MNSSILSGSCPSTNNNITTFPILDQFSLNVQVTHNPLQLPLESLFSMAARINKKRSFLFVSKLLGKHIPVNPYTSLLSGAALAVLLYEHLTEKTEETKVQITEWKREMVEGLIDPQQARQVYNMLLQESLSLPETIRFVGFAETATALGHSMYEMFADQASYIHTTREYVPAMHPDIQFEEEHSHAMAHRCYALDHEAFAGEGPIVLVDDEITTGKTTLNIIRDIQARYPRKQYVIASLLDWRTEADENRFAELEAELGITITPLSLLKGRIEVVGTPQLEATQQDEQLSRPAVTLQTSTVADAFDQLHATSEDGEGKRCTASYVQHTGRFGMQSRHNGELRQEISRIAERLRTQRTGERTLVMGTGEFMYIPMRIAAEMGEGVLYQSTTRSPIHTHPAPGYAVRSGAGYASPEDASVRNFIYNIAPGQYDEIFVLLERQMSEERMEPMLKVLGQLGCGHIHIVYCGLPEKTGDNEQ